MSKTLFEHGCARVELVGSDLVIRAGAVDSAVLEVSAYDLWRALGEALDALQRRHGHTLAEVHAAAVASAVRAQPAATVDCFVLDIDRGRPSGDTCLWWGPNDSGYTSMLEAAGRYPASDVLARLWYYNNGRKTRAVPCAIVEAFAVRTVRREHWDALLAAALPLASREGNP
jgi:hypothetical protein